jgi:hypothetical protein
MSTPDDPRLPLMTDLLDLHRARPMLAAALAPADIGDLRLTGVAYRPGRLITARYAVALTGEPEDVWLTVMHGDDVPDGGLRLTSDAGEVALWRFPDDPGLPGLRVLFDAGPLEALLGELGIDDGPSTVQVRAYQPGRRAVVEIRTRTRRLFAKVVRPKRVAELQSLHQALAPTLPIPRSHGWDRRLGIVVLEAVPGSSIAASLLGGLPTGVAGPDDLIRLLDLIAECAVDTRPRPPPVVRAPDHAATLARLLPEAADRAAAVAAAVTSAPDEPVITAHRDFHTSQLLVHHGILRLVDIDTVGAGTRADDLAMLLAQVSCLAKPGAQRTAVLAYRDVSARRFEEVVRPESLRLRTAAAILGFAMGPFRIQAPEWRTETLRRIDEAEWYVESAFKTDVV